MSTPSSIDIRFRVGTCEYLEPEKATAAMLNFVVEHGSRSTMVEGYACTLPVALEATLREFGNNKNLSARRAARVAYDMQAIGGCMAPVLIAHGDMLQRPGGNEANRCVIVSLTPIQE